MSATATASSSRRIVFQLSRERKLFENSLAPVAAGYLSIFAKHIVDKQLVSDGAHQRLDLASLEIAQLRGFIACYADDITVTADQVKAGVFTAPPAGHSTTTSTIPTPLTGAQQRCYDAIKNCPSMKLRQFACGLKVPGTLDATLLATGGSAFLSKDKVAEFIARNASFPGPTADQIQAVTASAAPPVVGTPLAGSKHGRDRSCVSCQEVLVLQEAKNCTSCGASQAPRAKYSCRRADCNATWNQEAAKFCHECGLAVGYQCCGVNSPGIFCSMCGKKEPSPSLNHSRRPPVGQSLTSHHSSDFFSSFAGNTPGGATDADALEDQLEAFEQLAYMAADAAIAETWLALPRAARRLYVQRAYLPLAAFNKPNPVAQLAKLPRVSDYATAAVSATGVKLNLLPPSASLSPISCWSDFLESLGRLHLLDAHLRSDRVQQNAMDYNIIVGISQYGNYNKVLVWYETSARRAVFATSAGRSYPGIGVPPPSKIAAWTAGAIGDLTKARALDAAHPRPKPSTPTKKKTTLPQDLFRKAKASNICYSFNKAGCTSPSGHTADRDGTEVAVTHACVACDAADHGYAKCPTKPSAP